jgi:cell division control protein 6
LIRDPRPLYHDYLPRNLPYREEQYKLISTHLKLLEKGLTPSSLLFLGTTGTGKTVTVRKAVEDHGRKLAVYVTCQGTSYTTLIDITEALTGVRLWGYSFNKVWETFERRIGSRPFVVILDELDKIVMYGEGEELLYRLSRKQNITIVGISNRMDVYNYIRDQRVKSSFTPRTVFFPPYKLEELREIVKMRANESLMEGIIDDGVINYIAALAVKRGGDARYAIDMLRFSVEVALKKDRQKISLEDVEEAKNEVETDYITKGIASLNEIQRTLLEIIVKYKTITPSKLVETYITETGDSLSSRRISDYINQLEMLGYITVAKKGMGRARGVMWQIQLSPTINPETIKEALKSLRG